MNSPLAYVWVFPMHGLTPQTGRKFPSEWVCAPGLSRVSPPDLLGASTWLIAYYRGKSLLFGHMVADRMEKLTEGMDADALILSADKEATFRILPRDSGEYRLWSVRGLPSEPGIFPATPQVIVNMRALLKENRAFAHGVSPMPSEPLEKSGDLFAYAEARMRYLLGLRSIPLGEMKWRASAPAITPYAHAAAKGLPDEKKAELDFWIRQMDRRICAFIHLDNSPFLRGTLPIVDLEFDEVDIGKISARCYVSSLKSAELGNVVSKTQKAEEAHQRVVRRLAEFLIFHGWNPLASRSIDMAVVKGNTVAIFEVKSSTEQNFDRQARQGIIQILEYGMWARRAYQRALPILVMPSAGTSARINYFRTLAKEAGVEFFLFSENDFPHLAAYLKEVF